MPKQVESNMSECTSSTIQVSSPPFPNDQEEKIEQTIALGQLEEMIEEGKDELKLIDMYYDAKMWEVVDKMNEGREDLALDDYTDPEDLIASGESAEASSSK